MRDVIPGLILNRRMKWRTMIVVLWISARSAVASPPPPPEPEPVCTAEQARPAPALHCPARSTLIVACPTTFGVDMPGGHAIQGAIVQWCEPATAERNRGVAPLRGGSAVGPYLVSYADGKPAHRGQFVGGRIAGAWEKWHANGTRASLKPYALGRGLHGVVTEWWPNGKLATRQSFVGDAQHGPMAMWHQNGKQRYEQLYQYDRLHGRYREWDDAGVLLKDLTFRHGEQVR
jgi:hypothetical protein